MKEANLAPITGAAGYRFGEVDLRTEDLDRRLAGADDVIHEARWPV